MCVLFVSVAWTLMPVGRDATLRLCNFFPHPMSLGLRSELKAGVWQSDYGWGLEPGDCSDVTYRFDGVEPNFSLFAYSTDEIMTWFTGLDVLEFAPAGASEVWACLTPRVDRTIEIDSGVFENCGQRTRAVFYRLPIEWDNYTTAAYYVGYENRYLPLLSLTERDAQSVVKAVSEWLPKRLRFYNTWEGRHVPYTIGAELLSEEAITPGVTVGATVGFTPFGVPLSMEPGDVIVSFQGRDVFDPVDVQIQLTEFAESRSGGIAKMFTYQAWRGSELKEWNGTFFFNEDAFPRTEEDRSEAIRWGLGSGATLGFAVPTRCGMSAIADWWRARESDPDCQWKYTQRVARLKQMYGSDYDRAAVAGAFGTAWVGPGAVRLVARGLGTGRVARVTAAGLVGAAEAATWTIREAAPGEDVMSSVRRAATIGGGVGLAAGVVVRRW